MTEYSDVETPFYNFQDVAIILQTTPSGIRHRLHRCPENLPPSVKIGRNRFWRKSDVEAWLENL